MRPRPHFAGGIWKRWITSLWKRINIFFSPCNYRPPWSKEMTWLSHHRFQNVFCPRKNEMCFRKCFRKAPFRAWLISVHGWSNRSRATYSTFLRHYFGQGLNRLLIAQNGSKYYFSSRLSILQSTYDQVNFVVPPVFTWTRAKEFWMRPKKDVLASGP